MSLISDALKTAQKERSGQGAGPGGQPLLEGFFPYVSTSTPEGRSRLSRIAVIGVSSVVILGIGAWFAVPAVRRAMASSSQRVPTIVLPPKEAAAPQPAPVEQGAPSPDTQVAAALVPDSAPAAVVDPAPPTHRARTPKVDRAEPRTVVSATEGTATRHDAAIAHEEANPPTVPNRGGQASRPNLEAEAVAAFNAGDLALARAKFDAAVHSAPTASGWTNYGVTLEKLGDQAAAMNAYHTAVGIDPNYFNAWLYLARVTNAMGDATSAVPLFNRAREIDPTNSDVNADLAELEYKAGAFTEARQFALVGTRSNPSNARAHYYLALSADTLKDRDVARQAFTDYLRTIAGQEKDNAQSIGYARTRLQELKGKP